MNDVFKLIQIGWCVLLMVIYASSTSNCLKYSKRKAEEEGPSMDGMQWREVMCCVHGVVQCPSLCQDPHTKLTSSHSHSTTAELNNPSSIPPASSSDNYCNFSVTLWLLQPSARSLLYVWHMVSYAGWRSFEELLEGLKHPNIAQSYICPWTYLFFTHVCGSHIYVLVYVYKTEIQEVTVFRWIHNSLACLEAYLRLNTPF